MAFELLRTDYKDAAWKGLRRYVLINNGDNTVSLQDVTVYTVYDEALFGANDANRINTAVNAIMAALEDGTDLYEVFMQFFENQKELFEESADEFRDSFMVYLEQLKKDVQSQCSALQENYIQEIEKFENIQQAIFMSWFEMIRGQLSEDASGSLQNQLNDLKGWRFIDGYLQVPYGGVGMDDGYLIIDNFEGGK